MAKWHDLHIEKLFRRVLYKQGGFAGVPEPPAYESHVYVHRNKWYIHLLLKKGNPVIGKMYETPFDEETMKGILEPEHHGCYIVYDVPLYPLRLSEEYKQSFSYLTNPDFLSQYKEQFEAEQEVIKQREEELRKYGFDVEPSDEDPKIQTDLNQFSELVSTIKYRLENIK
jgi:hypothetical protein